METYNIEWKPEVWKLKETIMTKSGPIIVIEDDLEDQQILDEIFRNLNFPNKVIFFSDGQDALEYLNTTIDQPFLILSDINMPRMDGFQVRNTIYKSEKLRCIPYLFFTTGVDKKAVHDAYAMSVQGFFLKPASMLQLQQTVKKIIDYWQECYAPSQFN
jgi:CheY-like chemotaxis protein